MNKLLDPGPLLAAEVRDSAITARAQPYRFILLQRVQDEFATLDEGSQQAAGVTHWLCSKSAVKVV